MNPASIRFAVGSAVLACLLSLGAGFGVGWLVHRPPTPAPDARVVAAQAAGEAYARVLASTYSDAWSKAADRLEGGSTLPAALAEVRPAWEAARTPQFEAIVRPAFAAIVPDSTPEEAIKPEDRKAMIAAFRAFARGLGPP